jgi:hypothetical protein
MRKTVVFHLEQDLDGPLHIGPRAERERRGRGERFDPRRKEKEEEKDESEFFVSIWVYTHQAALVTEASKLTVRFTKDQLNRMSVRSLFDAAKLFSTPGTINHFDVHVCFRRVREEGGEATEIVQSPEEFDFFMKFPTKELNRLPATAYTSGISPFTDLCGYILRSKTDKLTWLPITMRYTIWGGETAFDAFPGGPDASEFEAIDYEKGGLELLLSLTGSKDMLLNGPTVTNLPRPEYSRVLFKPTDTLDTIYKKIFSSEEAEAWGNFEEMAGFRYYNMTHEDINRIAIAYAIRHMRTSERIATNVQWIFTTYAPYVVRAKYSATRSGLAESYRTPREDSILKNPKAHIGNVLVDRPYVLWKPVHITGRSMAEYVRNTRGSRVSWFESMDLAEMLMESDPREDSSMMLVELIGDMYMFDGLVPFGPLQRALWSSDGNYSMFRQTAVPNKMSEFSGGVYANAMAPSVILNIDYTTSSPSFTEKHYYVPGETDPTVGPPINRKRNVRLGHRQEMSFEEYVRLQDEFEALIKDKQIPVSLLFADLDDRVSQDMGKNLNDEEQVKQRGFYQAWENRDPYLTYPLETPLSPLL